MLFIRFLIWSFGDLPVQWSGTINALLVKGILENIHIKLFEIWTSGSGGGKVYGRTHIPDAGQRPVTIAHLELSKIDV